MHIYKGKHIKSCGSSGHYKGWCLGTLRPSKETKHKEQGWYCDDCGSHAKLTAEEEVTLTLTGEI